MRDNALSLYPYHDIAGAAVRFRDRDSLDADMIIGFSRKNWRLCLIWLGVGLCAGIAFLVVSPVDYTAESTVLYYDSAPRSGAIAGGTSDGVAPAFVDTQIQVLQSAEVLGRVVDQLELIQDRQFGEGPAASSSPEARYAAILRMAPALSVRRIGTSDIVTVAFTANDRFHSATIASTIIQAYIEWRADLRRRDNAAAISEGRAPSGYPSIQVRVLTPAEPPLHRSSPRLILVLGISIVAAGAAGLGHSLLRQATDRSLKTPEDVQRLTGLDWVAGVPKIEKSISPAEKGQLVRPATLGAIPDFSEARAMLGLAARLRRRMGRTRGRLVIGVAAPTAGVETFSVAAHLADVFAKHGCKTLLVDANWQEPPNELVLPSWSPAEMPANMLPAVYTSHGELDILVMRAPSPISPLTASASIAAALKELREKYEYVVVDFHSADRTADLEASMTVVDRVVAVVETGQTRPEGLLSFLATLPEDKVEGVLVNKNALGPADLSEEFARFVRPLIGAWQAAVILMPYVRENLASALMRSLRWANRFQALLHRMFNQSLKSRIRTFYTATAMLLSPCHASVTSSLRRLPHWGNLFKSRLYRTASRSNRQSRTAGPTESPVK
jgi:capsular polysaccharide biosynthesis protein/Mrp family chromosome partitioning ATPase